MESSSFHSTVVSPAVSLQRVAVTGASGFIGCRLVDRLVQEQVEVVALSRRGTGRSDIKDLRVEDYGNVGRLAHDLGGSEVVFHLAARAHQLRESLGPQIDERYRIANVDSAVAVAQAARAAGVRRFVLISSVGVNGNSTAGTPFRADDPPRPVEPYAHSKWLAEKAIASLLSEGKTDYVIVRPPLVYGPGCQGNFDKLMQLAARAPILPFGGLHAPRTLVGVDNLVDAMLVAASHSAATRKTFLVTDGRDTDVAEIVRTLAQGFGRAPGVVRDVPAHWLAFLARMAGKQAAWNKLAAALQVDGSAFELATGWKAPFDPLEGLLEAARQHRGALWRLS